MYQRLHLCNSLNLFALTGEFDTVVQLKPKGLWRATELERRVSQTGRLTAEREAARTLWPRLQQAREEYVEWEAFVLWVRAVEEAEGESPGWLAKVVKKRCSGSLKLLTERKSEHVSEPALLWRQVGLWIDERIFGGIWREGWMNAVGYYAARDLLSLRNHAYWEYCEREWKRSKPDHYPSFREWLKASEHCSDRVLDACEMPEEKRRLVKLARLISPRTLRKAVERYVEWEVFAYWSRTALEAGPSLPASVEREVKRRCPGFLEADAVARAANPTEEPHCRFTRMMRWIEDHEFAEVQKPGWFDVLRYQVRLHARHARVIDYWHDWEAGPTKDLSKAYPSFSQWQRCADRYTFELDEG